MWLKTLKLFILLSILTGIFYPFLITQIASIAWPNQSKGNLLVIDGKVRGSELIAQSFTKDHYFWPRPSANNYDPLHSGGSNLGPTSRKLKDLVQERAKQLNPNGIYPSKEIPRDLLYASGSGLDPHISAKTAQFQLDRIANARKLSTEERLHLEEMVKNNLEGMQVGFLGPQYVNVLKLNILLDKHYAK